MNRTAATRAPQPLSATALWWHRRIYDAAEAFIQEHGYPPTMRDLKAAVGYRSQSSILVRLAEMRTAGNLTWRDGSPRTLRLLQRP